MAPVFGHFHGQPEKTAEIENSDARQTASHLKRSWRVVEILIQ